MFRLHPRVEDSPAGLVRVMTVPYRVVDCEEKFVTGGLTEFGLFADGEARSLQSFDLPSGWRVEFQIPLWEPTGEF